jgi:hypothetical protein
MKARRHIILWAGFVLVALLTWIVYFELSMLHSYRSILLALTITNFIFGLWLLIANEFAWRTLILVVLGLVVGQWWLIIWAVVFLIWSIRGFAP